MKKRYAISKPKALYKRPKRPAARSNPSAKLAFNKQGGVQPQTTFEAIRAKAADLGTLPRGMCGTRCDFCQHYTKKSSHTGYCKHFLVQQMVSDRQCCIYFSCRNWLRVKVV